MCIKNIYFVRHAQTIFNADKILQGQRYDSKLSNLGIIQSDILYSNFKNIEIDKIYISGLERSYLSAKKLILSNIPYEKINELNEISWGIIEGNKLISGTKEKYLQVINDWKIGKYSAKIENGENLCEVIVRLNKAIKIIMGEKKEENILVVTHGRVLKIILCILLKLDIKEMDEFQHRNMTMYHVLYKDNKFTIKKREELILV